MKRYLIEYDISGIGHYEESFVQEFDNAQDALDAAYAAAKEQFENNAMYSARELTKELADEYGLEWERGTDRQGLSEFRAGRVISPYQRR